jgi:hypothetical protein
MKSFISGSTGENVTQCPNFADVGVWVLSSRPGEHFAENSFADAVHGNSW